MLWDLEKPQTAGSTVAPAVESSTTSIRGEETRHRILVVHEDDAQLRLITDQIQAHCPADMKIAADGVEALRTIEEFQPELIIADIEIPRISGLQLCRMMQMASVGERKQTPVILLSEIYHDVIAEQVARNVNAFGCLAVPYELESLHGLVDLALGLEQVGASVPHYYGYTGNVLFVNPSCTSRGELEEMLREGMWNVVTDDPIPDGMDIHLIIAEEEDLGEDLRITVLEIHRKHPDAALILLTAARKWQDIARLLELGADHLIQLPLDLRQVRKVCKEAHTDSSFRAIHDQFRAKIDELRSLSDYLDMVIDFSQEAIFTCDTGGIVKIWNKGAEELYGYSTEEIIGKNVDEQLDPPDFKRTSEDVVKILAQRGSFKEAEVRRRRKNGEIFPVTATYSQLLDSQGEFIGFSVVERDVTPVKALEAERIKSARLRAITQTAVTANDHINTPLGVILGYSQFLKMKLQDISESDSAALEAIQDQVHKIKGIMNKLRLMSDPIVKNYSVEGITMLDLSKSK